MDFETVTPANNDVPVLIYVLRGIDIVGFITGLFFGQRLIRGMKKKK